MAVSKVKAPKIIYLPSIMVVSVNVKDFLPLYAHHTGENAFRETYSIVRARLI